MNELENAMQEARESIVSIEDLEKDMAANRMDYRERRVTLLAELDTQTECANQLEEEMMILRKKSKQPPITMNSDDCIKRQPALSSSIVLPSRIRSLDVAKYQAQFALALKCHKEPAEFLNILPNHSTPDAKDILIHLQGLPHREKMELQKMYHEMESAFPTDPILEEIEQQLGYYRDIFDFIREYRENLFAEDPLPVEQLVNPHEKSLIFLHNTSPTYLEDEIEDMSHNVYGKLYKAFAGFHYGYKRIEKSLAGNHVRGMKEVKERPIRLFITDLEDSYVVLGVMVKRVQLSQGYNEYIDRKMKLFYDNQDFLLEQKHTNPTFLQTERERAQAIEKVLLQKQEGTKVKKYVPRV